MARAARIERTGRMVILHSSARVVAMANHVLGAPPARRALGQQRRGARGVAARRPRSGPRARSARRWRAPPRPRCRAAPRRARGRAARRRWPCRAATERASTSRASAVSPSSLDVEQRPAEPAEDQRLLRRQRDGLAVGVRRRGGLAGLEQELALELEVVGVVRPRARSARRLRRGAAVGFGPAVPGDRAGERAPAPSRRRSGYRAQRLGRARRGSASSFAHHAGVPVGVLRGRAARRGRQLARRGPRSARCARSRADGSARRGPA